MKNNFRDVAATRQVSKVLKIGLAGTIPWIYKQNDEFRGSDMMMIKLLSKKLGFSYDLKHEGNHFDAYRMVK